VGGWEKFQKQKKKKPGVGQGENKVTKKKLRSGLRKGKEPGMIAWGWEPNEKHPNLITILPI
jgi:hypothetical protein